MSSTSHPTPAVALITGATGGLGRAFAAHYGSNGADLVLVARTKDALEEQAHDLQSRHGIAVTTISADLATPEGLGEVTDYCAKHRVDALVNNAGIGFPKALGDLPVEAVRRELVLDFHAPVMLAHAVLPQMLARGSGLIILVASLAGLIPADHDAGYVAAKAGLIGLARSLHHRYGHDGLSVAAVCPGFVRTGIYRASGAVDPELPSWMWSSPQLTVAASMRHLAKGKRRVIVPSFRDRLLLAGWRILPEGLKSVAARAFYGDPGAPGSQAGHRPTTDPRSRGA